MQYSRVNGAEQLLSPSIIFSSWASEQLCPHVENGERPPACVGFAGLTKVKHSTKAFNHCRSLTWSTGKGNVIVLN